MSDGDPIIIEGAVDLVPREHMGADWFTIDRRHHDGTTGLIDNGRGMSRLYVSARVSDADVEGTLEHMTEIAAAIRERRRSAYCKRCAADATADRVLLWSPRNSERPASITLDAAIDLAAQITARRGKR